MHKTYSLSAVLSIGYDDIDAEHERLVAILNGALRIIRAAQGQSTGALSGPLTDLSEAMSAHFAHEEQEMASLGYDELAQHRAHHSRCLIRLNAIGGSIDAGSGRKSVLDQVFDLIIDDVIRADSAFKTFLYGKGIIR